MLTSNVVRQMMLRKHRASPENRAESSKSESAWLVEIIEISSIGGVFTISYNNLVTKMLFLQMNAAFAHNGTKITTHR